MSEEAIYEEADKIRVGAKIPLHDNLSFCNDRIYSFVDS